jgi:CHASE2 domain-containing sensor protein
MEFKWYNGQALNVTIILFALIGLFSRIPIDWHFLNPLGGSVQDYDITDIVYSQIRDKTIELDKDIVLINTGQPDRVKIARMLDRIREAGATVIGVDVYFPDLIDPYADSLLAAALKAGGERIVLAQALGSYDPSLDQFEFMPFTHPDFSGHNRRGFINFPGNPTRTIRYFSPKENGPNGPVFAFASELIRQADPDAFQIMTTKQDPVLRIHYTATEDHFIRLEPEDVLDTTSDLRARLKDKIVIMGYSGRDEWNDPMLDRHYTPMNPHYTGKSPPDMFGFVIHANIVKMILDDQYIKKVPLWITFLLAFFICYLNVLFPMWIHGRFYAIYYLVSRLLQVLQLGIFFFLIAWLYDQYLIKLDFSLGFLALALVVDAQVTYTALYRHYRQRIRKWKRVKPG